MKVATNVRVDEQQLVALKAEADLRGASLGQLLREAVELAGGLPERHGGSSAR